MEQERNFKGLKKYEPLLKTVCCVDDYDDLPEDEWEGCLGVACVISVMEGVNANLFSLSKHLDIPHPYPNLQKAFERLKLNGIFSNEYNLDKDDALFGNAKDTPHFTGVESARNAWCIIAGIAAGKAGMREIEKKEENIAAK